MADDGKSAADLAAENELIREGIALNEKNLKIVKEIRKDQEDAAAHEAKRLQERTAELKICNESIPQCPGFKRLAIGVNLCNVDCSKCAGGFSLRHGTHLFCSSIGRW